MTLEEATRQIKQCAERMNELYRKTVFDEWAIVSFHEQKGHILAYIGSRKENFQKNFASDVEDLRSDILSDGHGFGDFEFARHGTGTKVEAFMVLGRGIYLICNNTTQSMDGIAKDPRWLSAQVPFAELSEKFSA